MTLHFICKVRDWQTLSTYSANYTYYIEKWQMQYTIASVHIPTSYTANIWVIHVSYIKRIDIHLYTMVNICAIFCSLLLHQKQQAIRNTSTTMRSMTFCNLLCVVLPASYVCMRNVGPVVRKLYTTGGQMQSPTIHYTIFSPFRRKTLQKSIFFVYAAKNDRFTRHSINTTALCEKARQKVIAFLLLLYIVSTREKSRDLGYFNKINSHQILLFQLNETHYYVILFQNLSNLLEIF